MLEIHPTWSWAAIVGTHGQCNHALDSDTTTPHHTSDGYSDGPPELWLAGQANSGCPESGHGWVVMPCRFPTGAMQFNGTVSYCSQRMDWWHQGGNNWWWMVWAYCTLLGQPKSPPAAIHCIYQGMHIMGISPKLRFGRECPTVVMWQCGNQTAGKKCNGKDKGWRWNGGYNITGKRAGRRQKSREEWTVVYCKEDIATNLPWGPEHSCTGTLQCWPNVLTHDISVVLEKYVVRYKMICCRLRLVSSNYPPEREAHGPPTTTSYQQWPLAKNGLPLYNRPADLGKWQQLHCNVCQPHDKRSHWRACWETINALSSVPIYFDNIACLHVVTQAVISNYNEWFTVHYWREVARILLTKLLMSTAIYLETDALSVLSKCTVVCNLHGFTTHDEANWDDYLPIAQYECNCSVYHPMKQMPLELDLSDYSPLLLDLIAHLQWPQANKLAISLQSHEFTNNCSGCGESPRMSYGALRMVRW